MALQFTRGQLLALAVLAAVAAIALPALDALPLFSDSTGSTEIETTELERLDADCRDDVGTYASSRNGPNGTFARTAFVETGSRDANPSAWAGRASPLGATSAPSGSTSRASGRNRPPSPARSASSTTSNTESAAEQTTACAPTTAAQHHARLERPVRQLCSHWLRPVRRRELSKPRRRPAAPDVGQRQRSTVSFRPLTAVGR